MHSLVRSIMRPLCADIEMACWLNTPVGQDVGEIAVVLCSAFGRRMHHHSTMAQYLVANGLPVLRFDAINHVGLSVGSPANYTMTDGLRCLRAAISAARELYPHRRIGVVATSLNARIALRAFAQDRDLAFVIGISGVLNVTFTLKAALGVDYSVMKYENLPELIEFEGQRICARPFYRDYFAELWGGLDDTLESVASVTKPVTWFVGERDDWIAEEDLMVFCRAAPTTVHLVKLEGCGHDIGRNPSIARRVLDFTVSACRGGGLSDGARVVEPPYKLLMNAALEERRLQRAPFAA